MVFMFSNVKLLGSIYSFYDYRRAYVSLVPSRRRVLDDLVFRARTDCNCDVVRLDGIMTEVFVGSGNKMRASRQMEIKTQDSSKPLPFTATTIRIMWTVEVTLATRGVILIAWNGRKSALERTLAGLSFFMLTLFITGMLDMRTNALS